ncbi:hypothetical protein BREVNS_0215 [Brevinematales bacterium NS]|nr:hypothetical protein BREVNS_0215 [Brevinematales bacterium NS]
MYNHSKSLHKFPSSLYFTVKFFFVNSLQAKIHTTLSYSLLAHSPIAHGTLLEVSL